MTDWNWHKATTLDERARLHRRANGESFGCGVVTERGRKRLAKWKAQSPFDAHPLLQKRFEQAGLTEAEVLELLSDDQAGPAIDQAGPAIGERVKTVLHGSMVATNASSETGISINGEKPDWAREIERALSNSRDEEGSFFLEKAGGRPEILFLELVRPMVARAGDRLRQGLQALAEAHPTVPFGPDVMELCLNVLWRRLLWVLMRTMALELNVARVQGLLSGHSGEERFASFINRIRQPQVRLELFREYPVLARVVVTILDDWVKCSL